MMKVIRSKPIAVQVEEILQKRIQDGTYHPGERMPSEANLAEELQVSRASLRAALASLAAKGLVDRRHGDGTYPRSPVVTLHLYQVRYWDIERQIRESGRTPSLLVLDNGQRPAVPDEVEKLHLRSGDNVLFMRRLFYADHRPVAIIANTIPGSEFKGEVTSESANLSPVEFLERHISTKPHDGKTHFTAGLTDVQMADLLEVEPGSPLLFMDSIVYDPGGKPIIYAREIYPGNEGFRLQLRFDRP